MVAYLVTSLFNSLTLPSILTYLAIFLLILALAVMLARNLLDFLTIKKNFFTFLLASTITTTIALIICEASLPGFFAQPLLIQSINIGTVTIQQTTVGTPFNFILVSLIISSFISFLNFLKS